MELMRRKATELRMYIFNIHLHYMIFIIMFATLICHVHRGYYGKGCYSLLAAGVFEAHLAI